MPARWGTFAIGLGLLLAPLVLGYASAAAILLDVSAGTLVCVVALAEGEWPRARVVTALAAIGLLDSGRLSSDSSAGIVELVGGALLLAFALVPRRRRVPPLAAPERVGAGGM